MEPNQCWRAVLSLLAAIGAMVTEHVPARADEPRPFVVAAPEFKRPTNRFQQKKEAISANPFIARNVQDEPAEILPIPSDESRASRRLSSAIQRKSIAEIEFDDAFSSLSQQVVGASSEPTSLPSDRDPYWGMGDRVAFPWEARNLAHRTLYFDDMPAERFGIVHILPIQPWASACEFIRDYAMVPFRWPHDRLHECHYVLGLERPGTCAPYVHERFVPHR